MKRQILVQLCMDSNVNKLILEEKKSKKEEEDSIRIVLSLSAAHNVEFLMSLVSQLLSTWRFWSLWPNPDASLHSGCGQNGSVEVGIASSRELIQKWLSTGQNCQYISHWLELEDRALHHTKGHKKISKI